MSGAWAKGSSAVASAPRDGSFQGGRGGGNNRDGGRGRGRGRGNNQRRGNQNNEGRGGRNSQNMDEGRGRGGGRNRNNNRRNSHQNRRGSDSNNRGGGEGRGGNNNNIRIVHKDVQLLNATGLGKSKEQRQVKRLPARELVRLRLQYLEVTDEVPFTPHEQCHWTDENRIEEIQNLCSKVMELGDVSKRDPPVTAPPLEDCAPLAVNEETRWKSKAMKNKSAVVDQEDLPPPETTEEIIGQILLILNKISWTTLDRLTDQFVEVGQIETNEAVRDQVIHLLIQKSQTEHHFGPMYAQLCAKIAKQFKPFKKELLSQCQKEFEIDTAHKIENAVVGITDKEEIEYHRMLIRKAYVGHIKFLGELYKRDVVKLAIMMYCLDELLKDEKEEDNLECFAHLMTTMGEKLDGHAKQNNKPFDWDKVVTLRNSSNISNRIKFLLQDLLDLRNNRWVARRKKETAVNLADLHKEIAKEEQASARTSKTNRRSSTNSNNLRRSQSMASAPVVDDDGFVQISRGSMKKVSSKPDIKSLNENDDKSGSAPPMPKKAELKRSQSQPASMSSSSFDSSSSTKKELAVLSPDTCSDKAKNLLKEYFVAGDTADSILTIHELVQVGTDGDIDRGAKVVEGGVFLVMEMKRQEAEKCAVVLCRAYQEGKLSSAAIIKGLGDPLEFLSDIEIDAPLAGNHLAYIVAEFLKVDAIKVDALLQGAPEYFKTDGKPALFCSKVLKAKEGSAYEPSEADLELISSLMTEADKAKFASAKALFDSI